MNVKLQGIPKEHDDDASESYTLFPSCTSSKVLKGKQSDTSDYVIR
jgi:hypothetical protein